MLTIIKRLDKSETEIPAYNLLQLMRFKKINLKQIFKTVNCLSFLAALW